MVPTCPMPALLTSTSQRPWFSPRTRSMSSFALPGSETSVRPNRACPPARWIAATTAMPRVSSRSATVTRAPAWPKHSAVAAPIPEPAPVTIATLFLRENIRGSPPSIEQLLHVLPREPSGAFEGVQDVLGKIDPARNRFFVVLPLPFAWDVDAGRTSGLGGRVDLVDEQIDPAREFRGRASHSRIDREEGRAVAGRERRIALDPAPHGEPQGRAGKRARQDFGQESESVALVAGHGRERSALIEVRRIRGGAAVGTDQPVRGEAVPPGPGGSHFPPGARSRRDG